MLVMPANCLACFNSPWVFHERKMANASHCLVVVQGKGREAVVWNCSRRMRM